jgi:NADH:ubiquinone oxidoreductase subunit 6 (subunit J)
MTLPDLFFYLIALVMLGSALSMMASDQVFRQAIYLAISLAMVAGLFVLLKAEFLAAVQILVYVGAVVILLIFAIMLTQQLGTGGGGGANGLRVPALLAALALVIALAGFGVFRGLASEQAPGFPGDIKALGRVLLGEAALPFELSSLALLGALVGAMVLARKEDAR